MDAVLDLPGYQLRKEDVENILILARTSRAERFTLKAAATHRLRLDILRVEALRREFLAISGPTSWNSDKGTTSKSGVRCRCLFRLAGPSTYAALSQIPEIDSFLALPNYLRNAENIEHILNVARCCRAECLARRIVAQHRMKICALQLGFFEHAPSPSAEAPDPAGGDFVGGLVQQCKTQLETFQQELSQGEVELSEIDRGIVTLLSLIRQSGIPFKYSPSTGTQGHRKYRGSGNLSDSNTSLPLAD